MPDTDPAGPHATAAPDPLTRDRAATPDPDDQVLLAKARTLEFIAAPVQHELANPLTALMLFGTMVRLEGGIPEDMRDEIQAVADAAERTYRLARTMLEITRSRPYTPQPVRIAPLTDEVVELLGYLLTDVSLTVDIPTTLPDVVADPTSLRLALVIVLVNAIRRLGGRKARGRLELIGRVTGDGRAVDLAVVDWAGPLDEVARARLFDATASVGTPDRADDDLAAARVLLRRDGGDLRFETGTDGSNRLVLEAPKVGRREPAIASQAAVPSPPGSAPADATDLASGDAPADAPGDVPALAPGDAPALAPVAAVTVLVCDDEDSIRALIVRVLERAGMRGIEAGSGLEALAVLSSERVDLVMADHKMAGISGTDLYLAARRSQPDLARQFVLMSGDATDSDLLAFAGEHGLRVLAKPFDLAVVPRIAREVAGG